MTSMSSIAVSACYVQMCKTHKNKVLCRLHSEARYGYMYVMDSLVPRLLHLKTGGGDWKIWSRGSRYSVHGFVRSFDNWIIAHTVCLNIALASEKVRRGDFTAGVKRAWNVITADSTAFFILRGILLPVFFKTRTGAGPVNALKVQSSNSSTKISRVQVHSLSEGLSRGLGVCLTRPSIHFHSSEYQSNSPL